MSDQSNLHTRNTVIIEYQWNPRFTVELWRILAFKIWRLKRASWGGRNDQPLVLIWSVATKQSNRSISISRIVSTVVVGEVWWRDPGESLLFWRLTSCIFPSNIFYLFSSPYYGGVFQPLQGERRDCPFEDWPMWRISPCQWVRYPPLHYQHAHHPTYRFGYALVDYQHQLHYCLHSLY